MSTVGILVRPDLGRAGPAVRELVAWLQARGDSVCIEQRTAEMVDLPQKPWCRVASGREVAAGADVLVVLGGDGTLLAASHLLDRPVPVLGVNFGSLGFLTEITMAEIYPTLEGVLKGDYRYEERRMLRADVRRQGTEETSGDVLNDVVVTKSALSRIIELDVAVDGLFVSAFRADGLIVSSPTGSTAYNLAAGGPILHPSLEAVVLTPICPHMLTNRPLVVSDLSTIEVRLRGEPGGEAHITLDGQRGFPLRGGDVVRVTRSARTIRLVKAPRDYFEVLRTKLKWGESKPQKP
ncbi:MAG TPA: NAD(+)/NADH kinase [Vicinamibacteria bacterium]|jgi:NAD+ kinase|nr:NAD(+)/NADH kinase [Vicinamibacteria bacterium]